MRRLRFFAAARRDVLELRRYLTAEARSILVARDFTARLVKRCEDLAALPGMLGRARGDLGPDLRSLAWRDYVIIFRYVGNEVQVIRILHGQRDLPAVLRDPPEAGRDA